MKYQNVSEAMALLRENEAKIAALGHAMSILNYDGETVAPKESADGRARTMGILSGLEYQFSTAPEYFELVGWLDEHKAELDPEAAREVQLCKRSCDEFTKIPEKEFIEYSELTSKASDVWREVKHKGDFETFAPYLEKIVGFNKKLAGYLHPEMKPYDALLDQYEEGLTMETLEAFFGKLRSDLVPLIEAIAEKPQPDDAFVRKYYPAEGQKQLAYALMDLECLNRDRVILGEVEHPFTDSCNLHDVRITTHYMENDLLDSAFSVLHEGGHAIYDYGSEDRYEYTVLCGGCSMSIHESQSRFYENIIGRSRAFSKPLYDACRKIFPEQLSGVSREQFWKAANKVQPSFIRTAADELTYPMHILVRYEIEKMMIAGDIRIAEVPAVWNELYKKYLGIEPKNNTEGCLQDVHWAGGSIGYFPSYALGSAYGAQMLDRMEKDVPGLWQKVEAGDLSAVTGWLHDKIHRHGSLYTPAQIMQQVCGGFDVQYYVDYLTKKFTEVYDL